MSLERHHLVYTSIRDILVLLRAHARYLEIVEFMQDTDMTPRAWHTISLKERGGEGGWRVVAATCTRT